MGNIHSGTHSCIAVHITRQSYTEGDIMEGVVTLDCRKQFHSEGLFIHVIGEENLQYNRATGEYRKKKKRFLKFLVPVMELQSTLNVGQYSFPFRFQLPENLSTSFEYRDADIETGVYYMIQATFFRAHKQELVHSVPLQIIGKELPPASIDPVRVNVAVTTFGVIYCGVCTLTLTPQQGFSHLGDTAILLLDIANKSTQSCSLITVKFKRIFRFESSSGEEKRWESSVVTLEVPGFPAKHNQQARVIKVKIPDDLPPTTKGHLVSCEYYFKLTARGLGGGIRVFAPICVRPRRPEPTAAVLETAAVPPSYDWTPLDNAVQSGQRHRNGGGCRQPKPASTHITDNINNINNINRRRGVAPPVPGGRRVLPPPPSVVDNNSSTCIFPTASVIPTEAPPPYTEFQEISAT